MSKLKIIGNGGGIGTFTIISPNSDTDATIELPHSGGTLVTNSQDLIPTQDEVYDLGSSTKKFKDVYLSGSTINLGNQSISASATGIIVPELQIGTGLGAVKLKASSDGKLKQKSNTADGIETPEIEIPEKLIDLLDIRDTAPDQNDKTLVWSDATSKFEFLTVPEVFSDFTDVDITTIPPTDTQVLTWSDANNEWGAGNNGFPLTVANTTEMIALTGMVVGQEAFVTDLNRSYTYTGSTPNDNWRHAVSGWYATDDIMTNHSPTTITGAPAAVTINTFIPTTFNLSTDDPDEKPSTFLHVIENVTPALPSHVQADTLVTITDDNGNITITNDTSVDTGVLSSNTFDVKFTVLDDSLYAVEGVESITQITRPNQAAAVDWKNNSTWSGEISQTFSIPTDPTTGVSWTHPHPYNDLNNTSSGGNTKHFGQCIDLDVNGSTIAISDPVNNRVHIYNYTGIHNPDGWQKNPSNITSIYPTGYGDTSAPPIGTYGGSIDLTRNYGKNQISLSSDGSTLAVAAMDSTDGSGSPHVEIWTHTNNIWSSQQKLYPFSDMSSLPQTALGMSVSLSSTGNTVVVGYRLAGQTIYQGSQFTTGDVHQYSNGQVYIYERNSNTNIWNTGFRAQGTYAGGSLGSAVDISGDGMYVAMSAPNAVNGPDTGESHGGVADGGYVLIYKKNPAIGWNSPIVANTWLLEKTIRPPVADQKVNNRFGFNSISLSFNGQHLAVGDIGQALTAVRNSDGIVSSYNYMTGTNHTFPNGIVYMYKKVSDNWTFNQYVENGSGTKEDGFGDKVSSNYDGKLLSVGAIYENTGFGFPYTLIGSTTFHDYSAKKVFNDWYRFSHNGEFTTLQPAVLQELNAWNYTEATEAINCTVNSGSYIGFVTPADGKATQYDLRVSFTSKNDWDNDMIGIIIAFTTDANGREHTISLHRSGGGLGTDMNYSIKYNYSQNNEQLIFNGNHLITNQAFVWGATVPATGEGQFVRNRITRIGDQFTITTSQLLHPNSHTGTDSDLDSTTTHTFNLNIFPFHSLFAAANGGARWGFSCRSQDLTSWVNVDLRDAVNPDIIEDTGAMHVFDLDSVAPSFYKANKLLPSNTDDPNWSGSFQSSSTNHMMHNTNISPDGKVIAAAHRHANTSSLVEVWKAT